MHSVLKAHWFKLISVVACPLLLIVGLICGIVGVLANLPVFRQLGIASFSVAMLLLLPLGMVASLLSWKMARANVQLASDSHDFVEFLLGSAGGGMIVLGVVLSPFTYWLVCYL